MTAQLHDPVVSGPRRMGHGSPGRLVMVVRGDARRAWSIIDAFSERTGLEARRSERVAEFAVTVVDRDLQVIATLAGIDPDWRDHVGLGPLPQLAPR
jgi:hypothetical protein